MALIVADRVQESSTTTGTGNFALAGANLGYRAFDDVMANGDTCYYLIEGLDANGNPNGEWEVGLGTFNDTDTLVRTTPQASSNAGAAVNFSAGNKRVILDATATYLSAAYRSGGTDVALADGGTGASLVDPNADRILFWDDSAATMTWLTAGSGLSISGTTISAATGASAPRVRRLLGGVYSAGAPISHTINVNSATYISTTNLYFQVDLAADPFTEYRITGFGLTTEAAQTITGQLARFATPTTGVHTGGNDFSRTGTSVGAIDSGWITRDDGLSTGLIEYIIALKGSNGTVDFISSYLEIHMR